jgi:hypothetical protein
LQADAQEETTPTSQPGGSPTKKPGFFDKVKAGANKLKEKVKKGFAQVKNKIDKFINSNDTTTTNNKAKSAK